MSDEQKSTDNLLRIGTLAHVSRGAAALSCIPDADGHCITCSDEALPATVVRIDESTGVAFVRINAVLEEVDITLVDDVVAGDLLLVHGGVAIANTGQQDLEEIDEVNHG